MQHPFKKTNKSVQCHPQPKKWLRGASMIEAMVAVPIVLVACLLTLQMMLLYRAKIALNFATQEAARVGAMSNGRVVPRFLTDVTRFSSVFRKKKKCTAGGKTGGAASPTNPDGTCPAGTAAENPPREVPPDTLPGGSASSDGKEPAGTTGFGSSNTSGGGEKAPPPPPKATSTNADAAKKSGNKSTSSSFMVDLAKGMLRYGDSSVLQGYINGIMPLYTKGTGTGDIFKAQAAAYGDAMMNSCIIYHNPTHAAFMDFGFVEVEGPDKYVFQIPNDFLRYRIPGDLDPGGKGINYSTQKGKYLSDEEGGLRGAISSMSVQEATLLSIEIQYSYPLEVPIAREILVGLARLRGMNAKTSMADAFDAFSFKNGRWPMSSYATYRMQTPVHWHIFYPFGNVSNIKTPALEAYDVVSVLWNKVQDIVNDKFDPAEPQIGFCPGLLIDQIHSVDTSGDIRLQGINNDRWFGKQFDQNLK